MIDTNWARWIRSSLAYYFKTGLLTEFTTAGFFIEGDDRSTNTKDIWFEMRMDGPIFKGLDQDLWRLEFIVNIICSADIELDVYTIDRLSGAVAKLMAAGITIYKNGTGMADNSTVSIGCVNLMDLTIYPFGQINAVTKLMQNTVEARYSMILP